MAPSDPFPTTPYISSSVGRLQLLMFVRWLHASYSLNLPTLQSKAEDSSVVSDCLNSSWNHPCSASMSPPLLNSPCVPAIPSSHITSALSVFSLSSKQLFSAHSQHSLLFVSHPKQLFVCPKSCLLSFSITSVGLIKPLPYLATMSHLAGFFKMTLPLVNGTSCTDNSCISPFIRIA